MTMPAYPSPDTGAAGPAAPGPRPTSVDRAFQLFLGVAALAVIGVVLMFLALPATLELGLEQARLQSPGLTPEDLQMGVAAVRIGAIVGAVLMLVIIGLLVLFTFKMRAGRGWARTTLTVVGGIGILFYGYGLIVAGSAFAAGGAALVAALTEILVLVLLIAAIVFMFRPDASTYFRRR